MTGDELIGKVLTCRLNGTRWIVVRIAADEMAFLWVVAADGSGEELCTGCDSSNIEEHYEIGGAEA